ADAAAPMPAVPVPVSRPRTSISAAGTSNDSALATPGQEQRETRADLDLNVFGYIRFVGSVVQDDPGVEFVGRNDGFRIQNARIGIEGHYRDRLYVRLSADGADDERL